MKIKSYLSLIKFSHTIFAMPFALIGFVLGYKYFYEHFYFYDDYLKEHSKFIIPFNSRSWDSSLIIQNFVLIIICMIAARSAAMAYNRYLDRTFDAKNPRTAIREIPSGVISPTSALNFTIICCVVFIIACAFLNLLVLCLAPVALFVILFYSYTKRFTALCHLVLGLGLALAPIGAFLSMSWKFELLPILFSFIVLFWVSGFDIIYALQDDKFDNEYKLHSIPAKLGRTNALMVSRGLHFICATILVCIGAYGNFHILFWMGAAVFIAMLIYQQSIVKPYDLTKVDMAFMKANGFASIVFAIFVISDILIYKQ